MTDRERSQVVWCFPFLIVLGGLALLLLVAASLSNEESLTGIAGVFGIVLGIGLVALFGVLYALCRDVDSRNSTT